MIVITGRMGSGKDSVLKLLHIPTEWQILDADALGHEALEQPVNIKQISEQFHGTVRQGKVDRQLLSKAVFPHRVADLNQIVHPWMRQTLLHRLTPKTIINAALLHELGLRGKATRVILVETRQEIVLRRLSNKYYRRDILHRLRSQRPLNWYRRQADLIITNNGSLNDLKNQVEARCQNLF